MTPKEKANEIYKNNRNVIELNSKLPNGKDRIDWVKKEAKRCSLLAINFHLSMWIGSEESTNYWQEVKQEIEKL